MALSAGTVTIAPDGTVSGSGYARALYDAEAAGSAPGLLSGSVAAYLASFGPEADTPEATAGIVAERTRKAAKCAAQAAATVALIQTGTAGGSPVV